MNRTEVQQHVRQSGQEKILITLKGWRGSGGKNGIVVLDNINITQVNTTSSVQPPTTSNPEEFTPQTDNEVSAKEDCLHAKVEFS